MVARVRISDSAACKWSDLPFIRGDSFTEELLVDADCLGLVRIDWCVISR